MLLGIGDKPAMLSIVSDAGDRHAVIVIKDPNSVNYFVTNMGPNGYVLLSPRQLCGSFNAPSSNGGYHIWDIPVQRDGSWVFAFSK